MNRAIIDTKSGEVLYELAKGDRVLRAASIERFRQINERSARHFVKADSTEGVLILKELSSNERSLMFLLQFYVAYETCLICYPNGTALSLNDIVKLSGFSRPTVSKTLANLTEKLFIYREKSSSGYSYYMNPWIVSKGKVNELSLINMFKDYEIRSKGKIKWGELEKSNG